MTEQTSKKLSHQAKGIILMFTAIPIIVFIKYAYDDNLPLGALASLLLALGSIELAKRES